MKFVRSYRANHTEGLDEDSIREKEALYQQTLLNDNNLPVEETTYLPDGSVEHVFKYDYTEQGKLIDELLLESDGEMAEHRSMEYDESGKLLVERIHYLDDTADELHHSYDESGNLLSRTSIDSYGDKGNSLMNEYADGRLVSESEYDADGELLTQRILVYDEKGRLEEETFKSPEENYRLVYDYDDAGNPELRRRYNAEGHLVQRHSFTYNDLGLATEIKEESGAGTELTYQEYDAAGNVVLQEERTEAGDTLSRVQRTYDESNRILTTSVSTTRPQQLRQSYRIRFEYS